MFHGVGSARAEDVHRGRYGMSLIFILPALQGVWNKSRKLIDAQKKHVILKSVHPSPLSASRGWFGCGHFAKANAWLEERYGPGGGVDWASLGAGDEK